MGAPLVLYGQMRTIVDDLARVIGQFDPASADRTTRAVLHASVAPEVIVALALLNKGLITQTDLTAARDQAYAENWSSVAEPTA